MLCNAHSTYELTCLLFRLRTAVRAPCKNIVDTDTYTVVNKCTLLVFQRIRTCAYSSLIKILLPARIFRPVRCSDNLNYLWDQGEYGRRLNPTPHPKPHREPKLQLKRAKTEHKRVCASFALNPEFPQLIADDDFESADRATRINSENHKTSLTGRAHSL